MVRVVLLLVGVALFCPGCLVVRSKRLSEPVAPRRVVRLAPTIDYGAYWYYHWTFKTNDFDLDVSAYNTKNRHQFFFWFYVLPLPDFSGKIDPAGSNLTVEIQIEPKGTNVVFDPSRTFYWATNYATPIPVSAGPTRVMMGYGEPEHGTYHAPPEYGAVSGMIPVTTTTIFGLNFSVNDDPDRPFVLSIEGLSSNGTNVVVPRIAFKPTTIIRPEMIMPY
jgi:hypothetical protein